MNAEYMKEMNLWGILKTTGKLYINSFSYIAPLCLLVFIPVNVIEQFVPDSLNIIAMLQDPAAFFGDGANNGVLGVYYLTQVIRLVFTSLAVGGLTYIAMARMTKRMLKTSELLDFSIMRWPKLAFTGLLYLLVISVSSVLIFPAIYFAVIFIFHQNIAAVTGDWGIKALTGSARIMKQKALKSFLYAAALFLMSVAAAVLLETLVSGFIDLTDQSILNRVFTVVIYVVIEVACAFFTLAQSVWFCNRLLVNAVNKTEGRG